MKKFILPMMSGVGFHVVLLLVVQSGDKMKVLAPLEKYGLTCQLTFSMLLMIGHIISIHTYNGTFNNI